MNVAELDFEQIVSAHYESLYRFALALTRNEADACDLTQDTFCTFATKSGQVRDASKIKTWLFTTLHRKFLGIRRHDTRFPHHEIGSVDYALPVISGSAVDKIDGASVLQALQEVDEVYRGPLVLFYLEDHSYREIAEILEVPLGTVMSRISRGKALLREQLEDAARPENKIVPLTRPAQQGGASS
jgi:RNA polymerase sigma factor (sigma-70 family)